MSTATMSVTCSRCQKGYLVPPVLQGKKIKCKQCGQMIPIPVQGKAVPATKPGAAKKVVPQIVTPAVVVEPEAKPASPAAPPPKDAANQPQSQEWGPISAYHLRGSKEAPRCPFCAHEMEEGEVICLNCGYNTITRERLPNVVVEATEGWDWFVHLTPGFVALFFCLLSIFIAQSIFTHVPYLGFLDWMYYDPEWKAIPVYMFMFLLVDIWTLGYYSVKRLIINFTPPDKIKHLELEDRDED